VSFTGCKTLNDIVEKACKREMKLDFRIKRNHEQARAAVGQDKKPKALDSSSRFSRAADGVPNVGGLMGELVGGRTRCVIRVVSRAT